MSFAFMKLERLWFESLVLLRLTFDAWSENDLESLGSTFCEELFSKSKSLSHCKLGVLLVLFFLVEFMSFLVMLLSLGVFQNSSDSSKR